MTHPKASEILNRYECLDAAKLGVTQRAIKIALGHKAGGIATRELENSFAVLRIEMNALAEVLGIKLPH